jgi:hypothetical protein
MFQVELHLPGRVPWRGTVRRNGAKPFHGPV